MKNVLLAAALLAIPFGASAATIVFEGDGPYDVTADTLFSGIVISSAGGAGTYTTDYFSPGSTVGANAEAAVTTADIGTVFTDLTMAWTGAGAANSIVLAPGLDDLSTVFQSGSLEQSLTFSWTDSVQSAGFGYDVTTAISPVPIPASALLLFGAVGGLGLLRRRRQTV